MKRILYLHAGAEMYGADKVLLELIKGLDHKEFEAHVILPNDGYVGDHGHEHCDEDGAEQAESGGPCLF